MCVSAVKTRSVQLKAILFYSLNSCSRGSLSPDHTVPGVTVACTRASQAFAFPEAGVLSA